MLKEIKSFLITETGRHISKRYSESAFNRYGHSNLVLFINEKTSHWPSEVDFPLRCWAVVRECTDLNICPTCGERVFSKTENGWNVYCNKECNRKDPSLSSKIKERRKKVDHNAANERRKTTMKEKFGVEFASQRQFHKDSISDKAKEKRISKFPLLENKNWLEDQHVNNKRLITDIADEVGVYYQTVQEALFRLNVPYKANCSGYNVSNAEMELFNFVSKCSPDAIQGDRTIIGKELDIYIPSKNLAIEFNGLFWHSIGPKPTKIYPNYHRDKTVLCNEKGIRLIHVNENEWSQKKDIIKSIILNSLGKTEISVGARKLSIVEVPVKKRKEFFNENHIQGDTGAMIAYGLERDGLLMAVISFSKPRFSNEADWEIVRYATRLNHSVNGGFSKLLNHFKSMYNGDIISYCDLMKGTGNLYKINGFVNIRTTPPGYYWTDKKDLYHRSKFMKKNLHKILPDFNEELSESDNMISHGYRKFFDCGNSVWLMKSK